MAKKRSKPTNLVLPILLVSTVVSILYLAYLNWPKASPVSINEVGSTTAANCTQGFTDNFETTDFDLQSWNPDADVPNVRTLTRQSGQLVAQADNTPNVYLRLTTRKVYGGDFVAEVSIPKIISAQGTGYAHLLARTPDSEPTRGIWIRRTTDNIIETYAIIDGAGNTQSYRAEIPNNSGLKLKIERSGRTFRTYYKTGDNYVLLGTFTDIFDNPVNIRLTTEKNTTAYFDDFSISCPTPPKPPAPTNLRSTCAPDGKSARLTWDGVVDAESYKVRLDDKAGHVAYYDNLKQTQYIVNTVPGKNYSFWVHSHKGDVDSNQSTAVDFTCQATSTPTPRPSIKASPIPTSTPETPITNIATPTPQATTTVTNTYQMSPRATQNTAINTEPTTAESTPTSTNPLYRFFSWIAGLFK